MTRLINEAGIITTTSSNAVVRSFGIDPLVQLTHTKTNKIEAFRRTLLHGDI